MAEEYSLIPAVDDSGDETGYYTREPDGVSGMTVSALADFCSTSQPTITQLLNGMSKTICWKRFEAHNE
jgi:hypothetical protein